MIQATDANRFGTLVQRVILRGDALDPTRPAWCARAPGRIDFMGGNVDYTGGLALQIPTQESIWAIFQSSAEPALRVFNPEVAALGWATELEFPIGGLESLAAIEQFCQQAPGRQWARFVLGALHWLHGRFGDFTAPGGILCVSSDIPPNRGVASSAALTISVLLAASRGCGHALTGMDLVMAAQWVENVVVGSACGVMDQAAIVFGARNSVLPILCQPCATCEPIPLPAGMRLWSIDSMVRRSTQSAPYERARAAAFMGYKMICQWEQIGLRPDATSAIRRWTDERWGGYPSRMRPAEFRKRFEQRLPETMIGSDFLREVGEHVDPFTSIKPDGQYPLRAAMRYAVEENARCESVRSLLESGAGSSIVRIGELLLQSHAAYAECGLGAHACDELVRLALDFGFAGAKMTGGGAGGVVTVLGRDGQQDDFAALVRAYAGLRGELPLTFLGSSDGAECRAESPAFFPERTELVL